MKRRETYKRPPRVWWEVIPLWVQGLALLVLFAWAYSLNWDW